MTLSCDFISYYIQQYSTKFINCTYLFYYLIPTSLFFQYIKLYSSIIRNRFFYIALLKSASSVILLY